MGTFRSRSHYFDPNYEPRIWPEEKAVAELLDTLQEEPSDEHRDAIVKTVGDLRSKVAELEALIREAAGCTDREWYSTVKRKMLVAVNGFARSGETKS